MEKCANLAELETCCEMKIDFAKIGFDTAKNDPSKILQNNLQNLAESLANFRISYARPAERRVLQHRQSRRVKNV